MIDNGGAQPPELMLSRLAERYGTLPDAGGLYDQDHFLILDMASASAYADVLTYYRSLVGEKIHTLSTGQRKILRRLEDWGIWSG